MNRRLIQSKLDNAALVLDKKGYKDLATKVDHYTEKFMKASKQEEVDLIKRALARINQEADRRDGKSTDTKLSIRERVEARRKQQGSASGLEERVVKLERRVARLILKGHGSEESAREARNARLAKLRQEKSDFDLDI